MKNDTVTAYDLRTDYRKDPLGCDNIPLLSWRYRGGGNGAEVAAFRILVKERAPGRNAGEAKILWDSGFIETAREPKLRWVGEKLAPGTAAVWTVSILDGRGNMTESAEAFFETAFLDESRGYGTEGEAGSVFGKAWIAGADEPAGETRYRKEFSLPADPVSARLLVYSFGWYEIRINGKTAHDTTLMPANSRYDRRLLYDTYDVTGLLRAGRNAVGVAVGGGYGPDYSQWGFRHDGSHALTAALVLSFPDGSRRVIGTGDGWKTAAGPATSCGIYSGEQYDARLDEGGWDLPGFDGSWASARAYSPPGVPLIPNMMPAIKRVEDFVPAILWTDGGRQMLDFGVNFAGRLRILVKGPAGTRIVLRHSENIDSKGLLDPWSNRNAAATDIYIKATDGPESWEPRFTYHGFRYVEVSGLAEPLRREDVCGIALRSAVETAGSWECSDQMLNTIYRNFVRGVASNLMSIPTDCPQRDERTPCLMDSQVVEEAAMRMFFMPAYYRKWLGDILGTDRAPDWSGDQISLPLFLYREYGDLRFLERSMPYIRTYLSMLAEGNPELDFDGFGDWCAPNNGAWDNFYRSPGFVNAALFCRFLDDASGMAAALGLAADEGEFRARVAAAREKLRERFWLPGKALFRDGNQTSQILGLAFGLVPDERRREALVALGSLVNERRGRLDTGIFSTRYLLDVMADGGMVDLAMSMLTSTRYPGFGDQVLRGATSTWEQWREKGGMHSHNHAMFAGVGVSFYTKLAGIRPETPGYGTVRFEPVPPSSLNSVSARLETPYGEVSAEWRRTESGAFQYEVELPPGANGIVVLPGTEKELRIGAGRHSFRSLDQKRQDG